MIRARTILSRQAARLAASLFLVLAAGCASAPVANGEAPRAPATPAPAPYLFDSDAAYADLLAQCKFGPRDPRLAGHAQCLSYILTRLKPVCDRVATQNFSYRDRARNVDLKLSNVFGVIHPGGKPRILISAHWDTRPTADNDFDIANRGKPILGADDGASGVAVLLELARVLRKERPRCEVVLGFWDGEDWGPGEDKMYLGSIYFEKHPDPLRPDQSILLDMIGQKGLVVEREGWSQANAPALVDAVWSAAASAGASGVFQNSTGQQIIDDQIPLAKLGAPSIDLIDFNYAYWHTLQDTPDKCDPKSLDAVGKTLEQYLRDVSATPA